ncbi:hypothetical protein MSG28_013445 [Choristoneura fumiferana]|uniref:Uncharacterized protein n=1 Tax=Choristoneura fumiferana TaxID=7141 RepID=A0ACC0KTE1_CHOFU|nr:hypothetical protein MSG28_013445 [Choristoneura fumiferana]
MSKAGVPPEICKECVFHEPIEEKFPCRPRGHGKELSLSENVCKAKVRLKPKGKLKKDDDIVQEIIKPEEILRTQDKDTVTDSIITAEKLFKQE